MRMRVLAQAFASSPTIPRFPFPRAVLAPSWVVLFLSFGMSCRGKATRDAADKKELGQTGFFWGGVSASGSWPGWASCLLSRWQTLTFPPVPGALPLLPVLIPRRIFPLQKPSPYWPRCPGAGHCVGNRGTKSYALGLENLLIHMGTPSWERPFSLLENEKSGGRCRGSWALDTRRAAETVAPSERKSFSEGGWSAPASVLEMASPFSPQHQGFLLPLTFTLVVS